MTEHEEEHLREKNTEAAEEFDPYTDGYPPAAAGDPGPFPFPTCATCGDTGFVEDAEDGSEEWCPECAGAAAGVREGMTDRAILLDYLAKEYGRPLPPFGMVLVDNLTRPLARACRLAFTALDAAASALAGQDPPAGSRLDDLCGELQAARDACEGALGRAEGEERQP